MGNGLTDAAIACLRRRRSGNIEMASGVVRPYGRARAIGATDMSAAPSSTNPGPAGGRHVPDELKRYVDRHPEWPPDFILIAREENGEPLTIWTVADSGDDEASGEEAQTPPQVGSAQPRR
jgi:hypothetical protein